MWLVGLVAGEHDGIVACTADDAVVAAATGQRVAAGSRRSAALVQVHLPIPLKFGVAGMGSNSGIRPKSV